MSGCKFFRHVRFDWRSYARRSAVVTVKRDEQSYRIGNLEPSERKMIEPEAGEVSAHLGGQLVS